jgi:hypothetical protein
VNRTARRLLIEWIGWSLFVIIAAGTVVACFERSLNLPLLCGLAFLNVVYLGVTWTRGCEVGFRHARDDREPR